ncbi:MAG: hypothetical protein P8X65_08205 [Syntrophobacterales bacterium]
MKRYLFFLRHFNDIDNIAPAIYFFLEQDEDHRADVVLYDEGYDYRKDPNLLFLKSMFGDRFSYTWLGEYYGLSAPAVLGQASVKRRVETFLHRLTHKLGLSYDKIMAGYCRTKASIVRRNPGKKPSVMDIGLGQIDSKIIRQGLDKLLSHPIRPSLVVFDINRSYMVRGLLDNLRALNIPNIICLPVSPLINYNVMREKEYVNIWSEKFKQGHDYSGFDALGYVDENFVCSYNKLLPLAGLHSDLDGKTKSLGSIRFCPQWLDIRKQMVKPYAPSSQSSKPKILFLLSRSVSNVNLDEVLITFEILNLFSDFEVLVKGHTREVVSDTPIEYPNIRFVKDEDSSALIDWADIILFWSTSVAIEGYFKDKTMVCLKYIVGNKNLYAKYDAGYIAHCRDDLVNFLLHYRKDGSVPGYNNEGKKRFLDEIVLAKPSKKSVPERYLEFMREYEWQP